MSEFDESHRERETILEDLWRQLIIFTEYLVHILILDSFALLITDAIDGST